MKAPSQPGGALTSSSMSTIRSPRAANAPALRPALTPDGRSSATTPAPWRWATAAVEGSSPSLTTITSAPARADCGITDESATSRYAGRARVGITIEAVGRTVLGDRDYLAQPIRSSARVGGAPAATRTRARSGGCSAYNAARDGAAHGPGDKPIPAPPPEATPAPVVRDRRGSRTPRPRRRARGP